MPNNAATPRVELMFHDLIIETPLAGRGSQQFALIIVISPWIQISLILTTLAACLTIVLSCGIEFIASGCWKHFIVSRSSVTIEDLCFSTHDDGCSHVDRLDNRVFLRSKIDYSSDRIRNVRWHMPDRHHTWNHPRNKLYWSYWDFRRPDNKSQWRGKGDELVF